MSNKLDVNSFCGTLYKQLALKNITVFKYIAPICFGLLSAVKKLNVQEKGLWIMNSIKISLVWRLHDPDWFYMKSLSNIILKLFGCKFTWYNFEFGVDLGRALKFL